MAGFSDLDEFTPNTSNFIGTLKLKNSRFFVLNSKPSMSCKVAEKFANDDLKLVVENGSVEI